MLTSYSSLIKILLFDNQLLIFWMRSVVKFFSYVQDVRSCLFNKLPLRLSIACLSTYFHILL